MIEASLSFLDVGSMPACQTKYSMIFEILENLTYIGLHPIYSLYNAYSPRPRIDRSFVSLQHGAENLANLSRIVAEINIGFPLNCYRNKEKAICYW